MMQVATFEQGLKNTLEKLTFSEKSLAQGLLYSVQHDSKTLRAWVRAPTLLLSQAIAQARDVPQAAFRVRAIELYCDTLTINCPLGPENGSDSYSVSIFARKLLTPRPDTSDFILTVGIVPRFEFGLFTPDVPDGFSLSFVSNGKELWRTQPRLSSGSFGTIYSYDTKSKTLVSADELPPPESTFESIDYLSLINPDGTVKDKGFLNDDLPRMLQMQLLVAQANSTLDKQFAIDILDYIVAASATPYNVYLNYQACTLRSKLSLSAELMAVSSVNIYSSKQVLKARLQAALAFETSFRDFSSQTANSQYQIMNALNLLAKSEDALETYSFLLGIKQREYDNAVESSKKASSSFSANQSEIEAKTKEFQAGVAKFKKDEERKAIFDCILGAVEVIGAIAATVATGGAAAPTIVAAGASAAKAVGKVAALIAKLKAIFQKLKEIYEKIKPVIEKLKALVDTAKTVIENLRKLKEVTGNAMALKPDTKSNDIINATAEWQRFALEITAMEENIRDYDIAGKQAFFMALKKLVINGQTHILAQANLVQRGDELATVIIQAKMEQRDKGRLSAMVYNNSASEKVLDFLRRAMFDRLLQIRGLVYLDFATYCSAYSYHTLRHDIPVSLSPVKPVADYLEDAAKLQGAVVSYGSRVLIQSRTFTLRTLCGYETAEELAADLSKGLAVSFTLTPDHQLWQGFSRIRLSGVRCYLEGLQAIPMANGLSHTVPSIMRLQLKTDGRFYDLQDDRPDTDGLVTDGTVQDQARLMRSFVGDPRRLLFEYQLTDDSIICDGMYGQERDYTKHTPITTWEMSVVQPAATTKAAWDTDFSAFTGVKVEFICEVVWSGY